MQHLASERATKANGMFISHCFQAVCAFLRFLKISLNLTFNVNCLVSAVGSQESVERHL